jgi:hypothetical protein
MQEDGAKHVNKTVYPVPHVMVCPVLRLFSGAKCDANMDSVLRMILEGLAREILDNQCLNQACKCPCFFTYSCFPCCFGSRAMTVALKGESL